MIRQVRCAKQGWDDVSESRYVTIGHVMATDANSKWERRILYDHLEKPPAAAKEAVAIHQFRHHDSSDWYDVTPEDHPHVFNDPDFVVRTVYIAPVAAAPVVPKARVTEPLRADESRQEQADNAIYNRGWNDCRAAMLTSTPAAPGIDLRVRELLARRLRQWRTHLPADPAKPGTRAIRTYDHPGLEGETDYNNDVAIWREACSVLDEALTLIDASPKGGSDGRATFQRWAVSQNLSTQRSELHIGMGGDYVDRATSRAWEAWQAAMQATSAEVGEN